MSQLFAGLTNSGEIKFVGDVERGMVCGCFCPSCNSPLVAKHGNVNEGRFAHEAGQERPDCFPGAVNLVRRIAIEHLHSLPSIVLPPYQVHVRGPSRFGSMAVAVEWERQPVEVSGWLLDPAKAEPVARAVLDSGAAVDLHVEVATAEKDWPVVIDSSRGMVVFSTPLPGQAFLRTAEAVTNHIRDHGRFVWVYQPDVLGHVAAAKQRLIKMAEAEQKRLDDFVKQRSLAAGRRWAGILKAGQQGGCWPKARISVGADVILTQVPRFH